MTYWIDNDDSTIVADDCLHSGITQDSLRGNLLTSYENTFFDLASYHHDGLTEGLWSAYVTSSGEYHNLVKVMPPIFIPFRYKINVNTPRGITVSLDGKIDTGAITLRAYFRSPIPPGWGVDPQSGIIGVPVGSYGEFNFTSTSYTTQSAKITPDRMTSSLPDYFSGMMGEYLIWVGKYTGSVPVSFDFNYRSIRVTETDL